MNVDVECCQHTEYFNPPLGYSGVIRSKSYDCVVKKFHFSVGVGCVLNCEEECEDVYYVYDGCFEIFVLTMFLNNFRFVRNR